MSSSKQSSVSGPSSKDEENESSTARPRAKTPEEALAAALSSNSNAGGGGSSSQLREACPTEKHHRNRLNVHFERLLSALPDPKSEDGHDGDDQPLNKIEVLELARRRIESLERERDTLKQQRSKLLADIGK
jgi:Helix-loop-helix DNA-binding domain